ncbi:secreted protein [Chrysochromulina tobinii]|uniref:Secreted protein n=1 Tax=Chrysochromulina tobinii TaxID=1460289 RepID=A0A0M0J8W3_9EUKA|nr:secreted protein [Chrysochromulina tobinii]|eukprot:KOO23014.1 secreted protein [Chrysochromulina sp. CCMP291]
MKRVFLSCALLLALGASAEPPAAPDLTVGAKVRYGGFGGCTVAVLHEDGSVDINVPGVGIHSRVASSSFQIEAEDDELVKLYVDFLTEEGYKPTVDSDGDVMFKKEGLLYYIFPERNDPQHFRIVLPNIWKIEDETERLQVLTACDFANSKTKVVKIFTTVKKNVWVSAELFVNKPEDFKPLFDRCISAIQTGWAASAVAGVMIGMAKTGVSGLEISPLCR